MLIVGANPSTLDFGTVAIGSEVILQTNFTGNALAPFEVNVASEAIRGRVLSHQP